MQKTVIVVPTYWGRASFEFWKEGDAIYDHATPLDQEGTLLRFLESVKNLSVNDFSILIIGCSTAVDIEKAVENKIEQIIKKANLPVNTFLFSHSQLELLKETILKHGLKDIELLSLRGYSNIRNACLYGPYLLEADLAVLIDDDEVFEDPHFMRKVRESVSENLPGVAGYYVEPDGNGGRTYFRHRPAWFWTRYWNKSYHQNQAFEKIIGSNPRLKPTPFAFGGCMAVHKKLFTAVPFHPVVNRGEDMDYVMNAKMLGFDFYLDNQLAITHLKPSKPHPIFRQIAEDMARFTLQRNKIKNQKDIPGMRRVSARDFYPYPGYFLDRGFGLKVIATSVLLALDYLSKGQFKNCFGALSNLKFLLPIRIDAFEDFVRIHRKWIELIKILGQIKTPDRFFKQMK